MVIAAEAHSANKEPKDWKKAYLPNCFNTVLGNAQAFHDRPLRITGAWPTYQH
jgi:hypothetical protein